MATKISALDDITTLAADDKFAVVDDTDATTKHGTMLEAATYIKSTIDNSVRVNAATGEPVTSTTVFDATAIANQTWETVGPTGSGADNIWTALDDVDAGADWIKIRVKNSVFHTAPIQEGAYFNDLFARDGQSSSTDASSIISQTYVVAHVANLDVMSRNVNEVTIPVDSSIVFGLYRQSTSGATPTLNLYLVGWGFNS